MENMKKILLIILIFTFTGLYSQQDESTSTNIPSKYSLSQNYPNPFNPSTKIKFELQTGSHVKVIVYNLLGRTIKTLVDNYLDSGAHEITFNATDIAAGVYFYKISANNFSDIKRMILLK
jgi:hypothetical protein